MEPVSRDYIIDVRRLRVLQELRDRGTIAATAEALHLTPSAVSQQIAKLSREIRAPLLTRQGRRVRLTEQAHLLLAHAVLIGRQMERARADLAAHRAGEAGTLALGAFASAITALVAPMLTALAEQRPRICVTVHESEAPGCFTQLDSGALDVAITVDYRGGPASTDARYHRVDLHFDPLVVAVPDSHPVAEREIADLRELSCTTWVTGADRGPCAEISFAACAMAGFTPDIRHRVNDWAAALALVATGTGIALVPRLAVPASAPGVTLRPLMPSTGRTIYAAVRAGSQDSPTVAAVLDSLRRTAARRAPDSKAEVLHDLDISRADDSWWLAIPGR
ncbi:MAG: LysR family transcriptional regulator [Streptosporangiaceae bacterium]